MNEHDEIICQVRESFARLSMDTRVEQVFARSRARQRRRLSGLTAAGAAATAAAAAAITLTLGGPAPARSGNPPPVTPGPSSPGPVSPGPASQSPVTLAAYSVTSGPGSSTTLILRKGVRLGPGALREDLARHGIPALVTVGAFCRSRPGAPAGLGQVLRPSTLPDGSDMMVINGPAMPPGTRLSIGYYPRQVRMALIEDGAPLACSAASGQPAARLTPAGTPIR
jgi:hypothetical protein